MLKLLFRRGHEEGSASCDGSKQRHELAAIYNSKAVIEFKLDGTIVFANDYFLEVSGYTLDELIGQNHRLFVSSDYGSSIDYRSFWDTLRSGRYITGQFQRFDKAGNELWLQAEYTPVLDDQGKPYKVIKFASNITEQWLEKVSADAQLAALHKAQAVIEFDLQGHILKANQNFLDITGYTDAEIIGQHHRLFVDPQERDSQAYTDHWSRLQAGNAIEGRFRRLRKNGKDIWMQGNYIPIIDPWGKPIKIVKFASDITQRVMDEQSLKRLLEEAGSVMDLMAQGDLTRKVTGSYQAPLNSLSIAINKAIDQISTVIARLIDSGATLKASAFEMDQNSQESRRAANATADEVRNASTTTDEVAGNTSEVAEALSGMTQSIQEIAEESYKAVAVAEQAVRLSDAARDNVLQLAQSSQDIGAVVKVISSIAEQTNLLALNATIEAARAGEAGRGFAVVANEVKELAKETAHATEEVSVKISAIQADSQATTRVINDISETIVGINNSQTTIVSAVERQRAVSTGISRTINESSERAISIAASFRQVTDLAADSLDMADQAGEAAEQLSAMATELEQMVSHFLLGANRRI